MWLSMPGIYLCIFNARLALKDRAFLKEMSLEIYVLLGN